MGIVRSAVGSFALLQVESTAVRSGMVYWSFFAEDDIGSDRPCWFRLIPWALLLSHTASEFDGGSTVMADVSEITHLLHSPNYLEVPSEAMEARPFMPDELPCGKMPDPDHLVHLGNLERPRGDGRNVAAD